MRKKSTRTRNRKQVTPRSQLPAIYMDGEKDKAAVQRIAHAMKRKESFRIITPDSKFDPLGYDKHSAEIWLGAAGGGLLMTVGAGALVLAFLDPEPTSKLGLLITGGIVLTLSGGGVILTVIITRRGYEAGVRIDQRTGTYEWVLRPR